ncbi:MAG: PadR family transcriptional regulator [Actinomycetota bacterium]
MERALPATSYAVLGMISLAPMSGYELALRVDRTIANFWQISKSQVYGELSRLEELGLVLGTDVEQSRRPDKRTYEVTASGSEALDEWLVGPGHGSRRLRSGLLLKVFFAHRMTQERFSELLVGYRAEAEAERDHLAPIVESLAGSSDAYFTRATALYGLRQAEASLAWIGEVEASYPKSSSARKRSNRS